MLGNVVTTTISTITKEKLCRLQDGAGTQYCLRPVSSIVTWGPELPEPATTTILGKVYLYRNRQGWLLAVASERGDLPEMIKIESF